MSGADVCNGVLLVIHSISSSIVVQATSSLFSMQARRQSSRPKKSSRLTLRSKWAGLTCDALRAELTKRGADQSGLKPVLVARLVSLDSQVLPDGVDGGIPKPRGSKKRTSPPGGQAPVGKKKKAGAPPQQPQQPANLGKSKKQELLLNSLNSLAIWAPRPLGSL